MTEHGDGVSPEQISDTEFLQQTAAAMADGLLLGEGSVWSARFNFDSKQTIVSGQPNARDEQGEGFSLRHLTIAATRLFGQGQIFLPDVQLGKQKPPREDTPTWNDDLDAMKGPVFLAAAVEGDLAIVAVFYVINGGLLPETPEQPRLNPLKICATWGIASRANPQEVRLTQGVLYKDSLGNHPDLMPKGPRPIFEDLQRFALDFYLNGSEIEKHYLWIRVYPPTPPPSPQNIQISYGPEGDPLNRR